ncbi:mammaglobin-A [Eulemur rufifrons]|uniref:mammaglobin-A n=1 Tax=Eulemur rufifrons TaxID=859984 RepID=UPI0037433251
MKLLTVLLLVALPLCCSAGSGCQGLEDIVANTLNRNLSLFKFTNGLTEFLGGITNSDAVGEFKQCFLDQSDETLKNIGLMLRIIYDSPWCASF